MYVTLVRPDITWTGTFRDSGEQNQLIIHLLVVVLLGLGLVGRIDWHGLALIMFGELADILVGRLLFFTSIPLYLDVAGAAMVSIILRPAAGMFCAGLAALVLGPADSTLIPFMVVNVMAADLAGVLARYGALESELSTLLSGLFCGVVAAVISTPMSPCYTRNMTVSKDRATYAIFESLRGALLGPPWSDGTPSDLLDKSPRVIHRRGGGQTPAQDEDTAPFPACTDQSDWSGELGGLG